MATTPGDIIKEQPLGAIFKEQPAGAILKDRFTGSVRVVDTDKQFDNWILDDTVITMDSDQVKMGDKEENAGDPPEGGKVIRYGG